MTSIQADPVAPATEGLPDLDEAATALVRTWLMAARDEPANRSAKQLADLLQDENGLAFAVAFIDGVIRPEDSRETARALRQLADDIPAFVPPHLRAALRMGAFSAGIAPGVVIPAVQRALRMMVGHLIIDASDAKIGKAIASLRSSGFRLNLNLLGEAVLGAKEAERRIAGVQRLLQRDDVDYVSVKVSAVVAPHSAWCFDEAVVDVVSHLEPLYREAAGSSEPKFINLDMEEYRDLELTMEVFKTLLDKPEFLGLEAGIVLQAYLPDALDAMIELQEWARARRERGGAPIKVRLVKGANLPMERVEADERGWPLATLTSKQSTDTNYKRVLDYALHGDRVRNVRIGVAGHNLFDIAWTWLLAGHRNVRDGVEFEMLLGMAPGQAAAIRNVVGEVLLYTPAVQPGEFDVAISYLIRRLDEGASHQNFMSAIFELDKNEELFAREHDRFSAALRDLQAPAPHASRIQDRGTEQPRPEPGGFSNAADTDPAVAANRVWGREVLARSESSQAGKDVIARARIDSAEALDGVLSSAVSAARSWGEASGAERATVLREAGSVLASRRGLLAEVMASECGKSLDQSDPEISEAIDFANYYAHLAEELEQVDGAHFTPVALTVVTPPWNFPVAIPAGSTLAALAAGSSVVIKPAPQAVRCAAVMVQALWDAGVPPEVLQLIDIGEDSLGRDLISDPRVDRLILTGAWQTAELFRSFRPDLPLLAETSGKNAVIVSPSADFDLAARDVVQSAFGHAGQKCSAASLVILVGSVARSERFLRQLLDAASSLTVGPAQDPRTQVGPLVEPAAGKLAKALTTLAPGEEWLLEPRQLDSEGRLWSPGIKGGVAEGSETHLVEFFGPVLGVMTADSLEHAVRIQNAVQFGLTAGLHSLDPSDVTYWMDTVQAGNLYVNRGITGAIVQRQPFGGWKRSTIGPGTKAGGPNYLIGLGDWTSRPAARSNVQLDGASRSLLDLADDFAADSFDRDALQRAFTSDLVAWDTLFARPSDVSNLVGERNVLRYLPAPVTVRLVPGASVAELIRCVHAGLRAGSSIEVSSVDALPIAVSSDLQRRGIECLAESDASLRTRLRGLSDVRVRLVGGDDLDLRTDLGDRPEVTFYAQPLTEAGRLELLPFCKEQAISITAHRFGNEHPLADQVL